MTKTIKVDKDNNVVFGKDISIFAKKVKIYIN